MEMPTMAFPGVDIEGPANDQATPIIAGTRNCVITAPGLMPPVRWSARVEKYAFAIPETDDMPMTITHSLETMKDPSNSQSAQSR